MKTKKRLVRAASLIGACVTFLAASQAKAQQCEPPQVLIVLDKSSSMTNVSADGVTPKWDIAVQAIDDVTSQYEDTIDYGLMIFPHPDECSPGQVVVDVGPYNSSTIVSTLGSPPPSSGNWTPMAQSLEEAALYSPLLDSNRESFVLLITDGWQWCSPYDSSTRFLPVDAVENLSALGITTYVVGFGDGVDTLTLNRSAVAGGTAFPGCDETSTDPLNPDNCYFMADVVTPLSDALQDIAMEVTQEQCDGVDNDCDGLTDENLTRPCETICGSGQETCNYGTWEGCTAPQPETEACDGVDNDCDGETDEGCNCVDGETRPCGSSEGACEQGTQTCTNGQWGSCLGGTSATTEQCDNLDNDCDGLTDESLYQLCQTACGSGTEICSSGQWIGCTAPEPTTEICDGIDNDCNGSTDESLSRACQTACGSGQETCNDGVWEGCTAQQPEPEECDDVDNDCDGVIDEGCTCTTGDSRPCGIATGACEPGTQTCVAGSWSDCEGAVTGEPEECDDLDNDCDGSTDEDLVQPCQTACGMGEEVCVNGQWHGCTAVQPSGEVCDGLDNDCNGEVDDGEALCGVNGECIDGECVEDQQPDAGTDPHIDAGGPGAGADSPDACGCRTLSARRTPSVVVLILMVLSLVFVGIRRRSR